MLMREALAPHLGNSMIAGQVARGVNVQWWTEFTRQAGPLGQTSRPRSPDRRGARQPQHAGRWRKRPAPILWLGAFYLLLWLFLSGGILDRYARARPTRSYEFFTACGIYFTRFLRLAPFIAIAYYVLFAVVHPFLFGNLYEDLIRGVTVERTAFFIRLAFYLAFGAVLIGVNVVFDYAKVRAVVEDRRSMIGAIIAAVRFVRRNARPVAALYLLNSALFVGHLIYALLAPGAESTGLALWLGIAVGQIISPPVCG
jgi:hypothetical protein